MIRVLLAAWTALLATATMAHAEWSIETMNRQIEQTNVVVGGNCSGTVIDIEKRLILTAYHCITGQLVEEEVKDINPNTGDITTRKVQRRLPLAISFNRKGGDYETVSSLQFLVKIAATDSKNDIAVLQVIDEAYKPEMEVRIADDNYEIARGRKVFAVGNPGVVYDYSLTDGIISAPMRKINIDGKEMRYFQHSASIIGGNSGGSILNEDGEIIGLVSAGVRGADIGFAVPYIFVKQLLRSSGFASVLEYPKVGAQ